jgi:protein O-GlcNAc transferase
MNRQQRRAEMKRGGSSKPTSSQIVQELFAAAFLHHQSGRLDKAIAGYRQVVQLAPDFAEAHNNLGITLNAMGRVEDAIACYSRAIQLKPDFSNAYFNLGNTLGALKKEGDAIDCYRRAIQLAPDFAEAHCNLGTVIQNQGHADDAIACYRKAIELKPDLSKAHYSLGTALQEQGRVDDAIACYRKAVHCKPDFAEAHSNLVMCLYYRPGNNGDTLLKEAQRFADQIRPKPLCSFVNSAEPGRKLRIGYVSANFTHHPVGYFLNQVLPNHDSGAVEIYCYSNSRVIDGMTAKLRGAAHHWQSQVGLQDEAAAAQIIADGIDILVDLSGHTEGNRLLMFACRAAPVQVTWLGFWGTTGVPTMDYILSDENTIPPGQEGHYSERVRRLSGGRFCYGAPDYAPEPVAPPSLAEGAVTFGSFNNLTKVSREVIRLWARVLHAVPDSRLLLKWKSLTNESVRQQLTNDFSKEGVGLERLILRGSSLHEAMLREYGEIDIALDPFPFSGGLTSCEALWMGVPLVTLPGPEAASRQTLGFLRAIERTEWVASSPEDYIRIASDLAADKDLLSELRAGQRQRIASSPLCDGKTFARQLEAAYRSMWQEWCKTAQSGLPT